MDLDGWYGSMNLGQFKSCYDLLYSDSLTVKRHQSITNDDGSKGITTNPIPVYSAVKCRLSYPQPNMTEAVIQDKNEAYIVYDIFCDNTYVIKKGDRLEVTKGIQGRTVVLTGVAGEPEVLDTHQRITLTEVKVA